MVEMFPKEQVEKEHELAPPPQSDLRLIENAWIRSAFRNCGLKRVPRETQMRLVVKKLLKKTKTCNLGRDVGHDVHP